MTAAVAAYLMNPAEDVIVFGDELAEGMWVLPEAASHRRPYGSDEDSRIRSQRFRQVTRLSHRPASGLNPPQAVFVGEWIDGYQEVHSYAVSHGWLVKKDSTESGNR
jgi:hypothetical protein